MQIINRESFASHHLLARLLQLHKPPNTLYIEGTLPEVTIDEFGRATPRILTVVGSRKNTSYAKDVINHLLSSLKGHPVVIVSGLALGVDTLAHHASLQNNLVTIAVPGSGLGDKSLYPQSNRALTETIKEKGGALFSELPPETGPAQWTFPSRNKIMAALSDAVLIIEAEEQSGTLITARLALELGKDIGAVPGSIFSPASLGTNSLLHDGAQIISTPQDLFDLLHLSFTETGSVTNLDHLTENEKLLLSLLTETTHKDTLFQKSNLTLPVFLMTLSSLEIAGYVQEEFGEVRKVV